MSLHLADDFSLPIEAVTETFAILAKRGKGKTNTAVVMAEEMIPTGMPVVVIDPVGVWWGLRSSADGKSAGLPVVIFGGDHGDVPLEPTAGELVADVLVDRRMSAVIDLSSLSKSASRRFMAPFVERLYHRNREAMHVIVDEADAFAPQRTQGDGARLLGAMEDLVRRGRARGIGVTLITQRPAVINKDVLTQAEVLIALGMTGPRDVAAIDEWVKLHADEEQAKEVKASLPSLPVGTAWIWSPGWLDILQRVQIRARRTFDSSATPKPGERRVTPQSVAPIDLDELGQQITATVERAKADDPKALRAEVARLVRELDVERSKPVPEPVEIRVEVPVLAPEIVDQLEALLEPAAALLGETQETLLKHRMWAEQERAARNSHKEGNQGSHGTPGSARRVSSSSSTSARGAGAGSSTHREKPSPGHQRETRPATDPGEALVPPARRKLLEALVALESIGVDVAPRNQVALFAGVSPKSSGYSNNLGAMNTAGLIEYPQKGFVRITDEGRAHVDGVPTVATSEELHARVKELISPARWRIIEPLIRAYPEPVGRDELADLAGVSAASSGYSNNLGALRSLGLLDYPGPRLVVAADVLFLGGA